MNGKEIIKRVIEFDSPPRIGLSFNSPHQSDVASVSIARLVNKKYSEFSQWGHYEEELSKVPSFKGEVRRDMFGNIYGRLQQKTSGECLKGALSDGWEDFDTYELPELDDTYEMELLDKIEQYKDRFIIGVLPVAVFSTMRDLRKIDNLFMDLLTEKEMVLKLLGMIEQLALKIIRGAAAKGVNGIMVYDDWGTQKALFINPKLWREIFKPVYTSLAGEAHKHGMKFFVHSCGYVHEVIKDFIEAGVDVLQFDQPELVGVEKLAKEFGGQVTFWSPVDIQAVMAKGDQTLIQDEALKMIQHLGGKRGGFIACDYGSWKDIDVKEEWAQWARDVFIEQGEYPDI